MKRLALTLLTLALTHPAAALTLREVTVTCPIDGKKFTYQAMMSGTSFGQRLDLKPIGPTAAPPPLPVCPDDHFVVFEEELDPATIEQLAAFIKTRPYRKAIADGESSYYLHALLLEARFRHPEAIGYAYLRASWQVEGDAAKTERYLTEALKWYERALPIPLPPDRALQAELITGELERRLARFDAAAARFTRLATHPEATAAPFKGIIAYQQRLITDKDRAPHEIPKDAYAQ
ncbi:MAG: DUF2225 domain-containing protein [Myxococcales bacterium]|nr:DUF2225 domain-containing protein [Myxococcales bacterium]